jgi:hypothetical protein
MAKLLEQGTNSFVKGNYCVRIILLNVNNYTPSKDAKR